MDAAFICRQVHFESLCKFLRETVPQKEIKKLLEEKNQDKETPSVTPFLSSTFRDFNAERDCLHRVTFPKIKEVLSQRGVVFAPRDLRWGLTSDESGSGKVVKICLEEVENCAPWFIGCLGFRNGWCLTEGKDNPGDELLHKTIEIGEKYYPWIKDFKYKSVTEIEVQHGVFNEIHKTPRLFFYIRSACFLKTLEEKDLGIYVDQGIQGDKLMDLKLRLILSGFEVKYFDNVEDLSALIETDLLQRIQLDFELSQVSTANERKSVVVIGRPEVEQNILLQRENPVLVTGDAGGGITTLLQKITGSAEDSIGFHFNADTRGELPAMFYHRAAKVFAQARLLQSHQIPTIANAISEWPYLIKIASKSAKHKRLIVALDGLENLILENCQASQWLRFPSPMPQNLCMLVATPQKSTLFRELSQTEKFDIVDIPLLSDKECQDWCEKHLHAFGKKLDPQQIGMVLGAKMTRNPRFLTTFLEELAVFGSYEKLNARMSDLLCSETHTELCMQIVLRLELDFDATSNNLVEHSLILLALANTGFSQSELKGCLKHIDKTKAEFPILDFTSLMTQLKQVRIVVPVKDSLLGLNGKDLNQAVCKLFELSVKRCVKGIADFFGTMERGWRKRMEYPNALWRLINYAKLPKEWYEEARTNLANYIFDTDAVLQLNTKSLAKYWTSAITHGLFDNGLKKLEVTKKNLSKDKKIQVVNSLINVATLLPLEQMVLARSTAEKILDALLLEFEESERTEQYIKAVGLSAALMEADTMDNAAITKCLIKRDQCIDILENIISGVGSDHITKINARKQVSTLYTQKARLHQLEANNMASCKALEAALNHKLLLPGATDSTEIAHLHLEQAWVNISLPSCIPIARENAKKAHAIFAAICGDQSLKAMECIRVLARCDEEEELWKEAETKYQKILSQDARGPSTMFRLCVIADLVGLRESKFGSSNENLELAEKGVEIAEKLFTQGELSGDRILAVDSLLLLLRCLSKPAELRRKGSSCLRMVSTILLKHIPGEGTFPELSGQFISLAQILDNQLLDWEGAFVYLNHALRHTADHPIRIRIYGWMARLHASSQGLDKALLFANQALEEVKKLGPSRFELWTSQIGFALLSDVRALCATTILSGNDAIDQLQKCLNLVEIVELSISVGSQTKNEQINEDTLNMLIVVYIEISLIKVQVLQGLSDLDAAQKESSNIFEKLATLKTETIPDRRDIALRSELFEVCALQDITKGSSWHASRLLELSLAMKLEIESNDVKMTNVRGLSLAEIRETLRELEESLEKENLAEL